MTTKELISLLREARESLKYDRDREAGDTLLERIDAALKEYEVPMEPLGNVHYHRDGQGTLKCYTNRGSFDIWKSTMTPGYRWQFSCDDFDEIPDPPGGVSDTEESAKRDALRVLEEME